MRSFCVTFQSVHVAIENANTMLTHPVSAVLKPVYGVSSWETLKGGCASDYAWQMKKRIHMMPKVNANA